MSSPHKSIPQAMCCYPAQSSLWVSAFLGMGCPELDEIQMQVLWRGKDSFPAPRARSASCLAVWHIQAHPSVCLEEQEGCSGLVQREGRLCLTQLSSRRHSKGFPGTGSCLEVLKARLGADFLHLEQAPQGMVTLPRLPELKELLDNVRDAQGDPCTPSLLVLSRKGYHG